MARLYALVGLSLLAAAGHAGKVGLSVIGKPRQGDIDALLRDKSPIDWYMTWSLYPNQQLESADKPVEFFPMVNRNDVTGDVSLGRLLPAGRAGDHRLLTFNEPDGEVATGGSNMSPDAAAQLYLEHIVPLRPRWNISHPTPTGSPRGMAWLRAFAEACETRNPGVGCPSDFVSVHWYGDLGGLQWWMGELERFYEPRKNKLGFWLTELALQGQDAQANLAFMKDAVEYLNDVDHVQGYAWFGAYRATEPNGWVGQGAALLDQAGALTDLGKSYLRVSV